MATLKACFPSLRNQFTSSTSIYSVFKVSLLLTPTKEVLQLFSPTGFATCTSWSPLISSFLLYFREALFLCKLSSSFLSRSPFSSLSQYRELKLGNFWPLAAALCQVSKESESQIVDGPCLPRELTNRALLLVALIGPKVVRGVRKRLFLGRTCGSEVECVTP